MLREVFRLLAASLVALLTTVLLAREADASTGLTGFFLGQLSIVVALALHDLLLFGARAPNPQLPSDQPPSKND